ncbi:MAG: hypothetical protein ABJI69_00155 [Balneola sp.]
MTGITKIQKERKDHLTKHGYTAEHDDQYTKEELLDAALFCITGDMSNAPVSWHDEFYRKVFRKCRVDQLAVAGALIAAEIDRLQRADA